MNWGVILFFVVFGGLGFLKGIAESKMSPSERSAYRAGSAQCRSCANNEFRENSFQFKCPLSVSSQNDGKCPNWRPKR